MGKENKHPEILGGEDSANRARNKTVMLTPEVANQMRSKLGSGAFRSGSTAKVDSDMLAKVRETFGSGAVKQSVDNVRDKVDTGAFVREAIEESTAFVHLQKEKPAVQPLEIPEESPVEEVRLDSHIEEKPAPLVASTESIASRAIAAATSTAPVKAQSSSSGDIIQWDKENPLVGFLVTFDTNELGDYFVLRSGRLIISSEVSGKGSSLILKDESVSPMHAVLKVSDKGIVVLDQLSENGTKIVRAGGEEIELSGDKAEVLHGDEVSFGDRNFKVCLVEK